MIGFKIYVIAFVPYILSMGCKFNTRTLTKSNEKNESSSDSSNRQNVNTAQIKYHGMVANSKGKVLIAANMPDYRKSSAKTSVASNTNQKSKEPQDVSKSGLSLAESVKSDYMTLCESKGVPLPPPWGDKMWKLRGALDEEKLFAGAGRTELWTYSDDSGTCAALPRYGSGDEINLFGVICASSKNGNTCFFDNADPMDGSTRIPVREGYTLADASGADVLTENCTACHRGENPWIIVPGQPTEKLPSEYSFKPVGPSGWASPMGKAGFVEACESCHKLPKLSESYCSISEAMFDRGVMPPDGTKDGVEKFMEKCSQL